MIWATVILEPLGPSGYQELPIIDRNRKWKESKFHLLFFPLNLFVVLLEQVFWRVECLSEWELMPRYFFPERFTGMESGRKSRLRNPEKGKVSNCCCCKWHLWNIWSDSCHSIKASIIFWDPIPMTWLSVVLHAGHEVEEFKSRSSLHTKKFIPGVLEIYRSNRSKSTISALISRTITLHVPIYAHQTFRANLSWLYGDVIEEIDWSVGQILRIGEGILENTLIRLFALTMVPWLVDGNHGGSAVTQRKASNILSKVGFECPTVRRMWKGENSAWSSVWGLGKLNVWFCPTFCKAIGAEIPSDRENSGKDLSAVSLWKWQIVKETLFYLTCLSKISEAFSRRRLEDQGRPYGGLCWKQRHESCWGPTILYFLTIKMIPGETTKPCQRKPRKK